MLLESNVTTSLMMATARIINPNLTTTDFNQWYNTELLPSFMVNHNASLGLRYQILPNVTVTQPPKWEYVALYKTHQSATKPESIKHYFARANEKRMRGVVMQDIGPDDVAIEITTWTPIQTFESLREKRGTIPAGRPKVACIVYIEPGLQDPDGAQLEDWYRKQHLDMFSMVNTYRRTTRYRSADGSKPRWLAIHELDSPDVDKYQGDVLLGTEMARNVLGSAITFDAANWELIFEKGNLTEKL